MADTLLQVSLYGLMVGSSFWAAFQIAVRVLPFGSLSIRWVAAVIVQCWLFVTLFHLLASLSLFYLPVALGILIILSLAVSRLLPSHLNVGHMLRDDLKRVGAELRVLKRNPFLWIFGAAVLLVGARFLRSLLAPPLGWDALTYHLPKATFWIQNGGYVPLPGPGANSYYQYYQTGGDLMWAWTMLPGPSDTLLGFTGLFIWIALVLALLTAIKMFQSDTPRAALLAVTIAVTPVILQYFAVSYVDILLLVYLVSATIFLTQWLKTSSSPYALLAAASLGLAAATKFTAVPLAFVGMGAIAFSVSSISGWKRRVALILGCCFLAAVGTPDYIKAWVETGSPSYPFEVKIGSQVLFDGNAHLARLQSGLLHQHELMLGGFEYFSFLFFESVSPWGHLNFGIGGLLLIILAFRGIIPGLRHQATRPMTMLVVVFSLLGIVPMLLDSAAIYHTKLWAPVVGRLFLSSFGLLAILVGRPEGKWFFPLWTAIAIINMYLSLPSGLGRIDLLALAATFPWIVGGMTGIVVALVLRRRLQRPWLTAALAILSILIPLSQFGEIRSEYRYRYYQAAADHQEPVFDAHQLNPYYASAWPLWEYFDGDRSARLAVTAGWDGIGHNWYWQPIFGRTLQNRLQYVPVTADGTLINPNERLEILRKADFPSWLRRVVQADLNAVILLGPASIERDWTFQHPFLFSPLIISADKLHAAFHVDSAAAIQFLRADTCVHRSSVLPGN